MIEKIISGGQTGADRAALDFAISRDIPHGGYVPKGRLTEEGPLPDRYHLEEMSTKSYASRTEKNIEEADGTLIVSHGEISGGTALTRQLAVRMAKPWLHVDLQKHSLAKGAAMVRTWLTNHPIRVMNVAGARASGDPKIYAATLALLEKIFAVHKNLK